MTINHSEFGIRVADTEAGRASVSTLINKMYAWRGYTGSHQVENDPNRITLAASDKGEVIGTITLGIDSAAGILADEIFDDYIDEFRKRGSKVCEMTKLAFAPHVKSKSALASLFHMLFIYGYHLHQCTDIFIEVNPRHRRYYMNMLGFSKIGEVRINPRVNAPAHLLHVSMDYVNEQIWKLGGTHIASERSLYPYFFSPHEEQGIADRLLQVS